MKNRYGVAILVLAFASEASNAAELKPETLKAWDGFVQMANSHMEKRLQAGGHFLWMDEAPDRRSRVRAGEILVSPVGENNPKRVPSGLIHDWIGAAFIPNATLDDVFAVLRNYSRYKEFYRPTVIEAKSLTQVGTNDKFTLLLLNKSLLSKTALVKLKQTLGVKKLLERLFQREDWEAAGQGCSPPSFSCKGGAGSGRWWCCGEKCGKIWGRRKSNARSAPAKSS